MIGLERLDIGARILVLQAHKMSIKTQDGEKLLEGDFAVSGVGVSHPPRPGKTNDGFGHRIKERTPLLDSSWTGDEIGCTGK